jgi:hypothetical protein
VYKWKARLNIDGSQFVTNTKEEHGKAVKWIGRYLKGTKDLGMIYKPKLGKGLEVYVDASFAGNWDKEDAEWDADTARSRAGYIVVYAGCPIVWASKLQGEIALSSTESEYLAISTVMREVLPLIEILDEIKENIKGICDIIPEVHCKVFEDNSGAVEVATSAKHTKMRPRTKHINNKYHHFRESVLSGKVKILSASTKEMLADILTKNCYEETLNRLRPQIMGW